MIDVFRPEELNKAAIAYSSATEKYQNGNGLYILAGPDSGLEEYLEKAIKGHERKKEAGGVKAMYSKDAEVVSHNPNLSDLKDAKRALEDDDVIGLYQDLIRWDLEKIRNEAIKFSGNDEIDREFKLSPGRMRDVERALNAQKNRRTTV